MKRKITQVGLFAGVGGFEYAARLMGWHTQAWVEIDPFCQQVLKKNFPHALGFSDIKKFNYSTYKSQLRKNGIKDRTIDILTGGFPCQPFSVAGERKGEKDERALWCEFDRIIGETKPIVVVAENVSGLLSIENGLVFERVCTDLESRGYQVQTFVIPACAVGAPHRRDRVWIVAYSESVRNERDAREFHKKKSKKCGQVSESVNAGQVIIENANCDGRSFSGNQKASRNGQFGNVGAGNGKRVHNESDAANTHSVRHQKSRTGQQTIGHGQLYETATNSNGNERQFLRGQEPNRHTKGIAIANSDSELLQRSKGFDQRGECDKERREILTQNRANSWERSWYEVATEFCRMDDGISPKLDEPESSDRISRAIHRHRRHEWKRLIELRNTNRIPRLKALGNAIVPQVVLPIFEAVEPFLI